MAVADPAPQPRWCRPDQIRAVAAGVSPRFHRLELGRPRGLPDLAGYVTSGTLRLVVNGVFPLADIAPAHRAFAQGGTLGKHVVVIAP
jgi:NADPH:quinone reductase-like Zn-dependent oxidoreductase